MPDFKKIYDRLVDIFFALADLHGAADLKILIIGAGKGYEALSMRRYFLDVTAVDIDCSQAPRYLKPLIEEGDAINLRFPDSYFDAVYCYHALEHIPEYSKAITQIFRVLKKGGVFYVGVPNKDRLFAYLFTKENSFGTKLGWLLRDYKKKLTNKFENRLGAHAGFTKDELTGILKTHFRLIFDKTDKYYILKYNNNFLLKIITRIGPFKKFIQPSLYFICRK